MLRKILRMIKKLKYLKYYSNIVFKNWKQNEATYSQHGEDNLVESILPGGVSSFIDIGASDGVLFSNTFKFAKGGAYGLCVEPSLSSFRKLKLNHIFHPRVKCIHSAISNKKGNIYLNEAGYEMTLSKVSNIKSRGSKSIKCQTFDNLIEKYPRFKKVDLLSIDVEGHEKEILSQMKNKEFSSRLIIIECDKNSINTLLKETALENYYPVYTNGINTVISRKNQSLIDTKSIPIGFKEI